MGLILSGGYLSAQTGSAIKVWQNAHPRNEASTSPPDSSRQTHTQPTKTPPELYYSLGGASTSDGTADATGIVQQFMDFMSGLELPVNDSIATALLLALIAFWRELAGVLKLPFTQRDRAAAAAVQEAEARETDATTLLKMSSQVFEMSIMATGREKEHSEDRQRWREEREALDTRLKEAQDQIKSLSEKVQKISIDNETKDRTIDGLIASNRIKDEEIARLKGRVTELEAEVAQFKAQQHTVTLEATVTESHPTELKSIPEMVADIMKEPATTTPESSDPAIAEPPVAPGQTQADVVPMASTGDGV